jgi:hypothetical protein
MRGANAQRGESWTAIAPGENDAPWPPCSFGLTESNAIWSRAQNRRLPGYFP